MRVEFLTGKRGGWGAMLPTLNALKDAGVGVSVLATDQHCSAQFGMTAGEVLSGGFETELIRLPGIRSADLAILHGKLHERWWASKPDILLLIGDRGESLVAAVIAQQMGGIIIAHVEGGDVTGCLDDSARHAISKLSHIHFCTNDDAARRLRNMGETNIHVVGDVHIDRLLLELTKPLKRDERFAGRVVIIQHPDTLRPDLSSRHIQETIRATDGMDRMFIYPCSDIGSLPIIEALEHVAPVYKSVPHAEFINGLRQARCLVGNSSSGVKEAPYLGCPSVDIGERQKGRPRPESVLWADHHRDQIREAINKCRWVPHPMLYGDGKAYERIVDVLRKVDRRVLEKRWGA